MLLHVLGFAVVAFPVVLMLVALGMARVEARLARPSVEQEVGEFLENATSADVDTLAQEGMGRALDVFRRRRHRPRRAAASRRPRVR